MESIKKIAQTTLGLILLVYGVNHFFGDFLELPVSTQGQEMLDSMGYWLTAVKIFVILVALALLSNRFVPLALMVLAPISLNILAFNLMFDIKGILPGLLVALLTAYLVHLNFDFYKPFLNSKAHL